MARIQAGSTLVNQYAPPFVVSDSIVNGWVLQWNETLKAFEAVDPDANTVYAGFNSIEVYRVENANQQTFVAPFATDSKESTFITIDGVKQQQDAYTWTTNTATNTTTVTLDSAVQNETVEILGLIATTGSSVDVYGPFNIDSVVAGTVNASYDIDWWAPTAESLIVTVDGVKQHSNVYNVQPVPGSNYTATRVTFPDRTITFPTSEVIGNSAGVVSANDIIVTNTAHGFSSGQGVYYSVDGGTDGLIGLTDNTLYYVEFISAFRLALHLLRSEATDPILANREASRINLTAAGNQTHALTLVSEPFLYVDTIAVGSTGGTGYTVDDEVRLAEGVFNAPAQITVTEVDNDADIVFSTDGSGNIALGALTINDGGSGYQLSSGGTFNITNNSLAGNGDAVVTYTTDVNGAIDSASVTTPGTGYTASQTDVSINDADLPLQNGALSGEITNFNFDFIGEYITFPNPITDVASTGGAGSGAVFNITKGVPRIEILGITTLGGAPASPVDATNLGVPIGSTTIYGLYDSKTVSGDAQVLNFKGISEGTGITLSEAGDTVQISAATALGRDFDQVGSGTSLFDANNEDANPVIFRRIGAGDGISISVPSNPDPQTDTIVVARNFNYAAPTSAATLGFDIAIPSTARIIGVAPFAGGTTLNLLAASELTAGDTITIKDRSGTASTNNIVVTPNGTDEIDGVNAAVTLSTDRAYITLYSDGSDWHIIGQG